MKFDNLEPIILYLIKVYHICRKNTNIFTYESLYVHRLWKFIFQRAYEIVSRYMCTSGEDSMNLRGTIEN